MSFLSSVVDHILKLHGLEAYLLVGGLAFAEAALLCRSPRYMAHFRQIKWPHGLCADTASHSLDLRR